MQHAGYFVDGVYVPHADHAPRLHIGKQRYFLGFFGWNGAVSAAQQRVGLNANFAQLLHGVLGRLGFQLTGGFDKRHIR